MADNVYTITKSTDSIEDIDGLQTELDNLQNLILNTNSVIDSSSSTTNVYFLSNSTSNSTLTELYLNGLNTRLVAINGKCLFINARICGVRSDGSAASEFQRKFIVANYNNTLSMLGNVQMVNQDNNMIGLFCDIQINNTTKTINVFVKGIEYQVNWVARLDVVSVGL